MDKNELMQKIAAAAPERFDVIAKFASELETGPFEEEVDEEIDALVKKAFNFGAMGQAAGNAAAGVGAAVATGILYSLAGDMTDAIKRGITKTRNYKSMLGANPDLKQMPAQDVQKAFAVLHRFNPDFASEPTVAGNFVRQQVNMTHDGNMSVDTKQLTELVNSRKNLADTRKLPVPGQVPWQAKGQKDQSKKIDALGKDVSDLKASNDLGDALMGHTVRGAPQKGPSFHPAPGGGQRTAPAKK